MNRVGLLKRLRLIYMEPVRGAREMQFLSDSYGTPVLDQLANRPEIGNL
jgi:hypothetical protein